MAVNRSNAFTRELWSGFENGKLSRRDFLRYATLLGIYGTAAYQMKGLLSPPRAGAAAIRSNETLRVATSIPRITHPARLQCLEHANILSNIAEYLTVTDTDNITHPYLLESWQVSEDFKTWALNVRKGIRFNNGDIFTADDVVFSMNQWLNKNSESLLLKIMGGYLDPDGIEKTNKYQVKLHLKRPEIAVPEHLFHYTAMILNHNTFEGDFIKAPHGTGPFTLEAYRESKNVILKLRQNYWGKGAFGNTPSCAGIMEFTDMGAGGSERLSVSRAAEIDMIDMSTPGGIAAFAALKDCRKIDIKPVDAGQHQVLRIPVDSKPWNDQRVRMALDFCQQSQQIFGPAYFFQGRQGHTFLAGPVYDEFIKKRLYPYQPEIARRLLNEAGYLNGLNVNLTVDSSNTDSLCFANALKKDARPAGINITICPVSTEQYWEKWPKADLNITHWTHQPLGFMARNQRDIAAYSGKPVSWMGVLMAVYPKIT